MTNHASDQRMDDFCWFPVTFPQQKRMMVDVGGRFLHVFVPQITENDRIRWVGMEISHKKNKYRWIWFFRTILPERIRIFKNRWGIPPKKAYQRERADWSGYGLRGAQRFECIFSEFWNSETSFFGENTKTVLILFRKTSKTVRKRWKVVVSGHHQPRRATTRSTAKWRVQISISPISRIIKPRTFYFHENRGNGFSFCFKMDSKLVKKFRNKSHTARGHQTNSLCAAELPDAPIFNIDIFMVLLELFLCKMDEMSAKMFEYTFLKNFPRN